LIFGGPVIGVVEHVRDPSKGRFLRTTVTVPGLDTAVVRLLANLGLLGTEENTIDVASGHVLCSCAHIGIEGDVLRVPRAPELLNLHDINKGYMRMEIGALYVV
jgi:hypothetical protein